MNPQEPFKNSLFLADLCLVFSGNHCRIIDNHTPQKTFPLDARPVSAVLRICNPSAVFGRVA